LVALLVARLFYWLPSHCCNVQSVTTGHDKIQTDLPGYGEHVTAPNIFQNIMSKLQVNITS